MAVLDPLRREPRVFREMCVDAKVLCPLSSNRTGFLSQLSVAEMWISHSSDLTDIKSSQIPGLENVLNQQIFNLCPIQKSGSYSMLRCDGTIDKGERNQTMWERESLGWPRGQT